MNAKNELQPLLQIEIRNKYLRCMEEIKKRTEVVDGFLRRELTAKYLQTTVESICLQIRKILELIALASLVANKSEYEKLRKDFQKDWHAKRILETLDKANPNFYPRPAKQIINSKTGKVDEEMLLTSGYLTREEFEELYDECCDILHAENPFSGGQQQTQSFLDKTPEWMEKIRLLLNNHHVTLIDEQVELWVIMKAKSDDNVHIAEMKRI